MMLDNGQLGFLGITVPFLWSELIREDYDAIHELNLYAKKKKTGAIRISL